MVAITGSPFDSPSGLRTSTGISLNAYMPTGYTAMAQATDFAERAQAAANLVITYSTLAPPVINPEFPTAGAAPALYVTTPPTISSPSWVAPDLPADFTEVLYTGDLDVEPFDVSPPDIVYGAPPALFDEALPTAPVVNLDFDDPELSVTLPAPPDLLSISVRPFSGLNMPTFSATEPELVAVAPSIREYVPGSEYTSALLTALQATLEARITTGGTGLGQNAETAIWDRGREREARGARDALADLERMEALGYALPPGVYTDARIKIITETDYAARGHSREVMVESARLELDNVKHALTTATQLESQLLDYNNAVEQRLFDSCRYATEAGIAIYNAKVQAYGTMVEVYKTKVAIYEAQVRAEVSRVEAYKAEIAAEEAKARVNVALVEQYKVQIEAALSNIEIYKAEIAGIQAKAEIERTKVMVFGEQVRGYTAQVNAYTAGVEGFRASLQAQQAKAEVYRIQVDAWKAQVQAAATQIESRIAAYKGRIEAKTLEWDGYKAQAQAEAARLQSITGIAGAEADIYRAEVTGIASYNEVLTKQWQAALEQSQRTAEIGVSVAKANAELYITSRQLTADAAKVSAQVNAQLGAAALNQLSFSSSLSASESTSFSNALSLSHSNSYGYNASDSSIKSVSQSESA